MEEGVRRYREISEIWNEGLRKTVICGAGFGRALSYVLRYIDMATRLIPA